MNAQQAEEVLRFWFEEIDPSLWFRSTVALDTEIRERFAALVDELANGAMNALEEPMEILAAVIAFDQFSRMMYRGTSSAFQNDAHAVALAKKAVDRGDDRAMTPNQRHFLYMPFMHSESLADQDRSLALFTELGIAPGLDAAVDHRNVVLRFGRFPHRNRALSRENTPDELTYLQDANTYGQ